MEFAGPRVGKQVVLVAANPELRIAELVSLLDASVEEFVVTAGSDVGNSGVS